MKLKSLQVENYKCIDDSAPFSVGPVTCLVGKNESGKSAILEALYRLNPVTPEDGDFDDLHAYPRKRWSEYKGTRDENPANVVTTVWEFDDDDRAFLKAELGSSVNLTEVQIRKGYDNELTWSIEVDETRLVKHLLRTGRLKPAETSKVGSQKSLSSIVEALQALNSPSERVVELIARISQHFPESDASMGATRLFESRLPKILYFANYYQLQGQVAVEQLLARMDNNDLTDPERVFVALLSLAGSDPRDLVSTGRFEALVAELEAVSNSLSEEIFSYWSQNKHLDIEFRLDAALADDPPPYNSGSVFRTRIKNRRHGVTVSFDERSSGFIWFLSFLVWFSQMRSTYGSKLLLLLDEPGLGLHARAQADLLRFINERLAPYHQVIYTTHSPFMIDHEDLMRVRTVEDMEVDGEILGTKVGDDVLSTDPDTIFPLQAALGYDITQTLFVGKNTLLVEGPSDLLYLKFFSRLLESQGRVSLDKRWVISPAGGIDKVMSFLALFGGQDLNVAVLTDFATGVKAKVEALRKTDLLKAGHVLTADAYTGQPEADIEDMMGRGLYVDLINRCYGLSGKRAIASTKPTGVPDRVLEEVKAHFMTLPPGAPEFDHYTPAAFLVEQPLADPVAGVEEALNRFEAAFKDLNSLLPEAE